MTASEPVELRVVGGRDKAQAGPHDLHAEACVVSAAVLKPGAAELAMAIVGEEHFFPSKESPTRVLWAAIIDRATRGEKLDAALLLGWIRDHGRAHELGPNPKMHSAVVAEIIDATPNVDNVEEHARRVFDLWRLRRAITLADEARGAIAGGVPDAQERLDAIASSFGELATSQAAARQGAMMAEAVREASQELHRATSEGSGMMGIPTGFDAVDDITAGLVPSNLYIIAGVPGGGKTAFALALAGNVADQRRGVVAFSLEMSRTELATRILCSEANVDVRRWRKRALFADDMERLTKTAPWVESLPIFIDDAAEMDVADMKARLLQKQREMERAGTPLGLVIVDYLQLAKAKTRQREPTREQVVSAVARGLKNMAKSIHVPIVCCAAISKESEKEQRPPRLTDLRESGEIEFAADFVGFLHRHPEHENVVALVVRKNRGGPKGIVGLSFTPASTKFATLEEPQRYDLSEAGLTARGASRGGGRGPRPEDKYRPRGAQ